MKHFAEKSLSSRRSICNTFVYGATGLRLKSRTVQIRHSVINGSPPLRHSFGRSCVAHRCNDGEMELANSCTLRLNRANMMEILFLYYCQYFESNCVNLWFGSNLRRFDLLGNISRSYFRNWILACSCCPSSELLLRCLEEKDDRSCSPSWLLRNWMHLNDTSWNNVFCTLPRLSRGLMITEMNALLYESPVTTIGTKLPVVSVITSLFTKLLSSRRQRRDLLVFQSTAHLFTTHGGGFTLYLLMLNV